MRRLVRFAEAAAVLLALIAVYLAATVIVRLRPPPGSTRSRRKVNTMNDVPSPLVAQLAGLARVGLGFLGGYLVSHGVITAEQQPEVIGAAMTVLVIVWGVIQKANAHKALKDAIAAPEGQAR